jgi:UPF0716 protein FxsA
MRIILMLLPWLELLTLIELGAKTSALTAVAYVLFTMILGLAILRRQGRAILQRLRQVQYGRAISPEWLLDDMAMGLVGLLLIVPGLITDFLAVLVLIGPLRRRLAHFLIGPNAKEYHHEPQSDGPKTIEGEFRRVDD